MRVKVTHRPSFSFAKAYMEQGESIYLAPGAMATLQGAVKPGASLGGGGPVRALFRRAAHESAIMAHYEAHGGPGVVGFAPPNPGDVEVLDLSRTGPVRLDPGLLLGYSDDVKVSTRVAGIRKIVLRAGSVGMLAEGTGKLVISSFGAIDVARLDSGENLIVDSGHIVAWSHGMDMDIGPLGGFARSGMIKEGLVGVFKGPGVVLVQTRMNPENVNKNRFL